MYVDARRLPNRRGLVYLVQLGPPTCRRIHMADNSEIIWKKQKFGNEEIEVACRSAASPSTRG